jgi:hypothetical protein
MKVSRKVRRRSRCSYSVSHRRLRNKKTKSGYRKKHTQRGGKHGKRGRGHKHARTHKRGRRFHRGGKDWPLLGKPDPVAFEWDNITNMGTIRNLRYNKNNNGNLKQKYDDFSIVLIDNKNTTYTITLRKIEGDSRFSFSFGPLSKDAVINTLYSAIKFGSEFQNVDPLETDITYTFDANEDFAQKLKTSLKSTS